MAYKTRGNLKIYIFVKKKGALYAIKYGNYMFQYSRIFFLFLFKSLILNLITTVISHCLSVSLYMRDFDVWELNSLPKGMMC